MIKNYRTFAKLGLIAAIFMSVSRSAFAQYAVQPQGHDHEAVQGNPSSSDFFATYNRDLNGIPCGVACGASGTAGRLGLGASPAHPEGPGNFSN